MKEPGASFEGRAEVVRRRWWLLLGAAVFGATSFVLASVGAPSWGSLVEQAIALVLLYGFSANLWPVRRRGLVRVQDGSMTLDGRTIARRGRVASAYRLSDESSVRLHPRRGGLPFDLRLESEGAAERIERALGFGIGQSIVSFNAFQGGTRSLAGVIVGMALFTGAMGAATGALVHTSNRLVGMSLLMAIMLGSVTLMRLRFTPRVDVGSDGLLVRRLGHHRFIPYAALETASIEGRSLLLSLRSGEAVRFAMGMSREQAESRDAIVQRIEEARLASVAGTTPEGAESLVAPGGRPVERWLRDVRALSSARDYREVRLDEHRLWRVVDDPAVPAAIRAGAALALASFDDASRARLRVAAEACAEPRLRVALQRVADGAPDIDLEEALAPLIEERA